MTREEAKREMMFAKRNVLEGSYIDQAYDKAIEALSQPERKTEWIPCSERLPEEGQIVLATHLGGLDPNRQVIEHIYSGGKFLLNWEMDMEMLSPTFGQRYMGDVIAWMPLPEPWEGEQT